MKNFLQNIAKRVMIITLLAISSFANLMAAPGTPTNFNVTIEGAGTAPATIIATWKPAQDADSNTQYLVYMATSINGVLSDFKVIADPRETKFVKQGLAAGTYKLYVTAKSSGSESLPTEKKMIVIKEANSLFKFISEPLKTGYTGIAYQYMPKVSVPTDYKGGFAWALVKSPDGMTITNDGKIEWKSPIAGVYLIVLTCAMTDAPKTIITQSFELKISDKNVEQKYSIISKPSTIGCINKEYVYEPKLQTMYSTPVLWKLISGPDGLTINPSTGRIAWAPKNIGEYKVIIAAIQIIGNDTLITDQSWIINVKENCEGSDKPLPCAILVGYIKDANGQPIASGTVKAIRLEKDNLGQSSYTVAFKMGQWSMKVREGSYKILFTGESFIEEWYKDAKEMSLAQVMVATCNNTYEIPAIVELKKKAKFWIVEGSVKNSKGEGIPNSLVQFIGKNRNGSTKENIIMSTKTDNTGNYRIELPENYAMIGLAIPTGDYSALYLQSYYDGKQNIAEATTIVLTQNTNINFVLQDKPVYKNGFAASLKDTAGKGLFGKIIALPITNGKEPKKGIARTLNTDLEGNAIFNNLEPGEYVLFGIPDTRYYAPGYYTSSGFAAKKWQDATRISVGDNMIALVFDIRLVPVLGKKGAAKLDGIINKKGSFKTDSPLTELSVGGAFIYAVDDNNEISDYCLSDDKGIYSIDELGQGLFTLIADKIDFEGYQSVITTDYTTIPTVVKNITLNSNSISDVQENAFGSSFTVYPNPTTSILSIALPHYNGPATIQIFSSLGTINAEQTIECQNGAAQVSVQDLPVGSYSFRIMNNQSVITGQFIIIR